jgi:SPP1 family predicted phage head-tail adaptor
MSISDYYTQSIVITSQSTSTGWGSEGSWDGAITVAAAVNPVMGLERYAADRKTLFADWKIFVSATVAIDEGNRITWDLRTLDVVHVKDTFNMGHHKRILCKEKSDA